jgi:hypothetical protein
MGYLCRVVLLAACLAGTFTRFAEAQETALFTARSRQIALMAEGIPWCRQAVSLRLELDPRRPELRQPLALSALMGNLRPLVTRACPQAAFASVQVTSTGRSFASLSASASGAWIFTTGRPIAAPPTMAFGTTAAPNAAGAWAVPRRTPAPPAPSPPQTFGSARPAWAPPATPPSAPAPPQARPAPPSFARLIPTQPSPNLAPAVGQAWPGQLSVRLANAIAPAGSLPPDGGRRLDNLRDARADALISGQPTPVSLLIQAGADGRNQVAASWPGSLALDVPQAQPQLVTGRWYLVHGALSVDDTPNDDPPAAARLQVQSLIACARPRCEDVANPDAIAQRRPQTAP